MEAALGVWGVIPSHLFSLSSFLSWPATLQPLALVVNDKNILQELNYISTKYLYANNAIIIFHDDDPCAFKKINPIQKEIDMKFDQGG